MTRSCFGIDDDLKNDDDCRREIASLRDRRQVQSRRKNAPDQAGRSVVDRNVIIERVEESGESDISVTAETRRRANSHIGVSFERDPPVVQNQRVALTTVFSML